MAKNVEMTVKQADGSYETIYPQTLVENISDLSTNLYTKNELLSSDTCELYGKNTPDEILSTIANSTSSWTLIQSYTTAGSYKFVVPEGVTKIGVYMIGAGGGGGFCNTTNGYTSYAVGGASGYGKNIILNVTPLQVINIVVGAKGQGATQIAQKNNGGSTSFDGIVVEGGDGGMGTKGSTPPAAYGGQGPALFNGTEDIPIILYGSTTVVPSYTGTNGHLINTTRQIPLESQNWFDKTMVTLCAGGYASIHGNVTKDSINSYIAIMPDGTKGGNGLLTVNSNGEDATGNGNGGGALCSTNYKKAGDGSDGAIWIYTQGVR